MKNIKDGKLSLEKLIELNRIYIRDLMNSHFNSVEHNEKRKDMEMQMISDHFKFIRNKWITEILWDLEINGAMIFNELMRSLKNISSRLLSDRLKDLKKYKLISRTLQDTSPPTVLYELTDKGKGFVELTMLLIFYMGGINEEDLR